MEEMIIDTDTLCFFTVFLDKVTGEKVLAYPAIFAGYTLIHSGDHKNPATVDVQIINLHSCNREFFRSISRPTVSDRILLGLESFYIVMVEQPGKSCFKKFIIEKDAFDERFAQDSLNKIEGEI